MRRIAGRGGVAVLVAAMGGPALAAFDATLELNEWIAPPQEPGDFFEPDNWSFQQVPGEGTAVIDNGGTALLRGGKTAATVLLGYTPSGKVFEQRGMGTLVVGEGGFLAGDLQVGAQGDGRLVVEADGRINNDQIVLGFDFDEFGLVNGKPTPNLPISPPPPSGLVEQLAGSEVVTDWLTIGREGEGKYEMRGGTLGVAMDMVLGQKLSDHPSEFAGRGEFIHALGTVQVGRDLVLGDAAGTFGGYGFESRRVIPSLAVGGAIHVGRRGTGVFDLGGGDVTAGQVLVGSGIGGQGTIEQASFSTLSTDVLILGAADNSVGEYLISRGALNVEDALIVSASGNEGGGLAGDGRGTSSLVRNATGLFTVRGNDAEINVGRILAQGDHPMFRFEFASQGVSPIHITGKQTTDLTRAMIDLDLLPAVQIERGQTFTLFESVAPILFNPDLIDPFDEGVWDIFIQDEGGMTKMFASFIFLPGDFDLDGDVDAFDLGIWQAGFGTESGAFVTDGDADLDGDVDAFDLGIWQATFGTGGAEVPEPGVAVLFVSLWPWVVRGRRERAAVGPNRHPARRAEPHF